LPAGRAQARAGQQRARSRPRERQLKLIRAHPELAGKAMVSKSLTAESTNEQGKAGLTDCTPAEFAHIQQLNAAYNAASAGPSSWPCAGRAARGLTRAARSSPPSSAAWQGHADFEFAECLRNIHRIAEIRLNDKFGRHARAGRTGVGLGRRALAAHSDPGYARKQGQLTVTYLTEAHQRLRAPLQWLDEGCGFDEVQIDAVGNVVGVYHGSDPAAPRLLTGSHYDTVRNGGKYDGRLGILVPMAVVRELHRQGRRLPFGIEVVAFAEEEGQRYKATFLGSGALTGDFDPAWLDQQDAEGVRMRDAMRAAGLPARWTPSRRCGATRRTTWALSRCTSNKARC
jgi:N-carbamoyl-L-amino-acid hydrolase